MLVGVACDSHMLKRIQFTDLLRSNISFGICLSMNPKRKKKLKSMLVRTGDDDYTSQEN
jgi:hypothetical protein